MARLDFSCVQNTQKQLFSRSVQANTWGRVLGITCLLPRGAGEGGGGVLFTRQTPENPSNPRLSVHLITQIQAYDYDCHPNREQHVASSRRAFCSASLQEAAEDSKSPGEGFFSSLYLRLVQTKIHDLKKKYELEFA